MALLPGGFPVYLALVASALWLRNAYREFQFQKFASSKGCRPASHSASKLPWGIDRMWRMVKLTGQHSDVMENVIMPSFAAHGNTHTSAGLFGEPFILTADPENLQAIFATQFNDFLTGPNRAGAFGYLIGKSLFTTDGPEWEHARALFRPHFGRGEINDLESTERAVQDLLHVILAKTGDDDEWTPVTDLQQLFLRFTMDTGSEFFMGANVKSQLVALSTDDSSASNAVDSGVAEIARLAADKAGAGEMTFTHAFHVASVEVTKRAKLQSLYWLVDSKPARQAVHYLQNFVDQVVAVQLGAGEKGGRRFTLLNAIAQDTKDPVELRDQTLFMLTAARDTTAALLSWLFLMLAKHQGVFDKLRAEILRDFGTKDEPQDVTFYRLKKCLYLQWTMSETLRLCPPGPLNSRIAARDTTLPVGGGPDGKSPIAVRKGQTVNMSVYAMQRRKDLWGPDVMEFKPERWEGRKSDWSFLPFSGGPRTCLGKEYALSEAGFLIVRLLQHFDRFESPDDLEHIPQFVTVTLEPTNGVKLRLRKAR